MIIIFTPDPVLQHQTYINDIFMYKLGQPWNYFCPQTLLKSKLFNPTHTLKISAQYLKYVAHQLGSKFM